MKQQNFVKKCLYATRIFRGQAVFFVQQDKTDLQKAETRPHLRLQNQPNRSARSRNCSRSMEPVFFWKTATDLMPQKRCIIPVAMNMIIVIALVTSSLATRMNTVETKR